MDMDGLMDGWIAGILILFAHRCPIYRYIDGKFIFKI